VDRSLSYTRRVDREWLDRRFDDALLAISMETGFLYVRRRVRRVLRKLATGTAIVTGVGVATVAVTAGLGALGTAVGAAAWLKARARRSAAMAQASGFGSAPAGATTTTNSDGPAAPDTALESSVGP
jgi:hypothetical protein